MKVPLVASLETVLKMAGNFFSNSPQRLSNLAEWQDWTETEELKVTFQQVAQLKYMIALLITIRDISYYYQRAVSFLRQMKKFLSVRWLSAYGCNERLIQQYRPLLLTVQQCKQLILCCRASTAPRIVIACDMCCTNTYLVNPQIQGCSVQGRGKRGALSQVRQLRCVSNCARLQSN